MSRYSIGLDFGTESVRAVVVDVADGTVVASAVSVYPEGVIDRQLPGSAVRLPGEWALQSSTDWLTSMEAAVREAVAGAGIEPHDVLGIGIDFTACTVLPTTADGVPLHTLPAGRDNPHAWPKLWKHHAAQPQADRVNAAAGDRNERWLARYGGRISSEWLLPKALEILEAAPQTYAAAERIVEGADWVVWQVTGRLARNACAAGYKGTWHATDGYPSEAFLATLQPGLADLYTTRIVGPVLAPGSVVGELTPAWAERLGLAAGTPVAAPIIDAHAAVLGGGIAGPGAMFIMMGSSSCHMLMAEREVLAEGLSGVVEGGIVPGLFAYEAGQAGVGDILAWFVRSGVPPALHDEADRRRLLAPCRPERAGGGDPPGRERPPGARLVERLPDTTRRRQPQRGRARLYAPDDAGRDLPRAHRGDRVRHPPHRRHVRTGRPADRPPLRRWRPDAERPRSRYLRRSDGPPRGGRGGRTGERPGRRDPRRGGRRSVRRRARGGAGHDAATGAGRRSQGGRHRRLHRALR